MTDKIYHCPYEDCTMATRLDNMFQHIRWKHELKERFVVIDTQQVTIRLMSARAAPAELKEQVAEVPA